MKEKQCPKCKVTKSVATEFGRNKNEKHGVAIYCKECFVMMNRANTLYKNPEHVFTDKTLTQLTPEEKKIKARKYQQNFNLKKFNLTTEKYMGMLLEQNYKCLICSKKFNQQNRIHIDHCHTKGNVRGLLCLNCNLALGHVKDDASILRKMIKYLSA